VHAHRRLRSLTTACSNRKQHPTDDGSVLHPKREVKSTRHYGRFRSPERLSSLRTNCLTPRQHGILILRRQFGTLNHKCLRRLEFRRARSAKRRSSATRGRFARVNTDVVELAILRHTALLNRYSRRCWCTKRICDWLTWIAHSLVDPSPDKRMWDKAIDDWLAASLSQFLCASRFGSGNIERTE
jgi:hypothetical protein